ncbi:DNA polymerase Y family protein [Shewanella avicenniae]|uniref:DNA polymerase Y family protein n=1 Tax=Shewanella avicenniae TaxID=2814294 RepID=A0ABX7QUS7_9GAMM|nr:DNA polymerase Y family protein [Shewanella avicenniae]QSX35253.1 DNA polymerase Y family protein [Shewanella avicenniae]
MAECWLAVYFHQLLLQFHAWSQGCGHYSIGDVYSELPPQALFDKHTHQIVAASPNAAVEGVVAGLSVTTAQALLPTLQLTEQQQVDQQRLQQWLCQWHYDFSARIWPAILADEVKNTGSSHARQSMLQQTAQSNIWPQETLVLEVGSMLKLFGGQAAFITAYQQRLAHYGLRATWALAQHPLQAAVLARKPIPVAVRAHQAPRVSTPRQTRYKMNTDCGMSSTIAQHGIAEAESGYHSVASALPNDLPLQQLPLPAKTLQRLSSMGISCWQQLQALPRAELGKRFGQELLTLLMLLEGRISCQRQAYELPLTFRLSVLLSHDVAFIQGLIFPLSPMLTQLADYLRGRQLAVRQISITLQFRGKERPAQRLDIDYPLGEYRADGLLKLCRLQLERVQLPAPVTDITLLAEHFVCLDIPAASLTADKVTQPFAQLLAKLQARLGNDKVRRLHFSPHPLPELSGQSLPIERWPPRQSSEQPQPLALRPLWLLPEPEAIFKDELVLLRGPERVCCGWFQELARDYYLARHHSGRYCWVFRQGQSLWLHGWMS